MRTPLDPFSLPAPEEERPYLSQFAFAPPPTPPRDGAQKGWTLDRLLRAFAARELLLVETSAGLRLLRAYLHPPEADQAVREHADTLRVALGLGPDFARGLKAWGPESALHARWLLTSTSFRPPAGGFLLRKGEWVTNPDAFMASMRERLVAGPHPGSDRLVADLRALFQRYAVPPALAPTPSLRRRAA